MPTKTSLPTGMPKPLLDRTLDRANSARDYLIGRGVGASRFVTEGRGAREPVADNSTAEGRAMNRRVEIFVAEPATTAQR